jgi:polysaccharide export outer membrane protein
MKRFSAVLLSGFMAASFAVTRAEAQGKPQPQAQGQANAAAEAAQDSNYVIGPQDVLAINVWKEPELTASVPVRSDGKISMPLLNDVQAAGLTPMQLMAQITAGLKKFVTDPQVTVTVTQMNSQRIYLMGEVLRPGAYALLPGATVLQALSGSGGFTQFANTKNIYVLRVVNGKKEKYPFNYKAVISGKSTGQDIVLQAGDTIVVP